MKHIEVIVTNLLKSYDHNESSARKAAVFCLVSLHNLAGADAVTPYFNDLEGSKDIGGELQRKTAAKQRAGGRAHFGLLSIGDCCLDFFDLKEIFAQK